MATFGSTPPRDPLAEMTLAISDLELLRQDALRIFANAAEDWTVDAMREAEKPQAEFRKRIDQARRDDAALPQTRFGDYPTD